MSRFKTNADFSLIAARRLQCASAAFGASNSCRAFVAEFQSAAGRINDVTRKVLMVEDSAVVTVSVTRWLKHEGYEVIVAHSCMEAKAAAKVHEFSAHVIDLDLPDGDGVELAQCLRQEHQSAITIFYTGHSAGSDALEHARHFGRVVIKGESPQILLSALRENDTASTPSMCSALSNRHKMPQ